MDSPVYVLKLDEGVLVPKDENSSKNPLKLAVLIIIGIIILGSIVFGENLFKEMTLTSRILLISLFIGICFKGQGSHRVPSPMEVRFYEDYLIIYREKRYYSKKVSRKEFNKFFYKDISRCQYRTLSRRINIYGIMEGTWYDYNKDGSVPDNPTYNRVISNGLCYFYTIFANESDIISNIEKYCKIQIIREDI